MEKQENIPVDELRFRKFEFEHQLERQKIFLKYLHYLSTPLVIISLFYSMTLTASIILILLALRSFCIFRLERFEFALFQKHMVIIAFEFHKNNPELCQGLMERDPDKLLKSQLIVAKKLEQNFEEFQKQQQRQMKSKEKSQGKPLKVSFKKNSKANKISRSEKRIRTIVGIIDEWNKTAITSINQNILLL